ncbi:MAG: preprotein translocase subunit SecE [Oligoflexia bacterium]|jgi:preprotein translocase SecE subunit
MENQQQKWVTLSYLAVAILLSFVVLSLGQKLVGAYDLEARVRNIELILRGGSILLGAVLFFGLYRSQQATQFVSEVVVELSRVTWPTQKETSAATVLVIVMVLISGLFLGFLDYLWTVLLKWVI